MKYTLKFIGCLFMLLAIVTVAYAADQAINARTELAAAPAENDILPIYDTDATAGKRITVLHLMEALESSLTGFEIHADNLPATDAELAAIAGLTFADVSIIQLTGASAAAVLTSGGNNYILGSNSDNSALEFKTPANVLSQIGAQAADSDLTTWAGITPSANLQTFLTTPNAANFETAIGAGAFASDLLGYANAGAVLSGIGAQASDTDLATLATPTAWRVFYSNGSQAITELALGSDGTYLRSNGASAAPTWDTPSGAAHDAVTLSTDLGNNLLGLSTQQLTLDNQTANYVFAGPTSGGAAAPAFRAMVLADIPASILVIESEGIGSNDNDTTIPTSAAVKDYADSVAGAPTNVTPVDTADENATFYPLLVDGATGSQVTETDGELTYNPSTGVFTIPQLNVGAGGFLVDADGDTTVKSLTVTASASPGITGYDSDSPGADKTAGFLGWQYVDGADGAENSDWLLQIMQGGTLTTIVTFDESDDQFEFAKPLNVTGSVTATGSYIIGGADLNETDLEKLDGITNGTQAANKAVVADANVNIGVVKATALHIGASGSETQVTATAAELNYNDIASLGTGAASKAVVLDGSGNYTAPAGTWDLSGATAVTLPSAAIAGGSRTPVIDDPDNFAANFTGANLYGGTFIANVAGTAALPDPAAGMNFTIVLEAAAAVVIDPLGTGTADTIVMNGLAAAQDENITSSTVGAICVFQYRAANSWMATCDGFTEATPP